MTDSAPLRRLARRVHVRALLRVSWRRVVDSWPAALQITIAVVAAYSIAHYGFGHPTPLIAATVTLTSLGIARDARPRRVLEIAVGVTIGIALSEVLVLIVGKGPWQLGIVLFATLIITRAFSANPAFAVAAAVQSIIVMVLPAPPGGPFGRSIDALIAGVVALAVTALIPRDPRRAAANDARALFSVFGESLDGLVEGLQFGHHAAAELALERLRRTQGLVDNWSTSLETATSVSRISPWLRRHLPELAVQSRVLAGADLASRHLRTIARRVTVVIEDDQPRLELAALIGELATAMHLIELELADRNLTGAARTALVDLAERLDPETIMPDAALRETLIVVLVRPLVVDLLIATGLPADEARALLPPL